MTEEENKKEENISKENDCVVESSSPEEENYQEKYLRLLAETENMRKRMYKEKQEMTRFAIENILEEILMPIDMLENALGFSEQMSPETRNWAKGFEMILAQFKDILLSHNVVSFHAMGELFDPHKHEAVEIEETKECAEGTILHEFVKGYKSGDRTLRAARVKVAKTPQKKPVNQEENKE